VPWQPVRWGTAFEAEEPDRNELLAAHFLDDGPNMHRAEIMDDLCIGLNLIGWKILSDLVSAIRGPSFLVGLFDGRRGA
jgi:hypothetical protein